MKYTFLFGGDPEMQAAWERLRAADGLLPGDYERENEGQHWHYMGTSDSGKGWGHCFRHRAHPTRGRCYETVPAMPGWAPATYDELPDDIQEET